MQLNSENLPTSGPRLTTIDPILAAFLALLLFGLYLVTFDGTLHSTDGLSMVAVTENLIKHGRFDTRQLENWENVTLGSDGKPYTVFPIGPSLWMAPFFALALVVPWLGLSQTTLILMPLASALSTIYLYLSARRLGYSPQVGIVVTLLAGLATMTWLRTRDLVADPLILFAFNAAFYYALAYRQDKKLSQAGLMSLVLSMAILHKLVHAITLPFFFWYLAVPDFSIFNFKKFDWRALLLVTPPVMLSILIVGGYNLLRFGDPLDSGFRGPITFSTPFWIGFIGVLISPYRSLFLYIPLFMLIPFTFKNTWQYHRRELLLIMAMLLSHMVVFGAWHDWGGGKNWGPRYLAALNGLLTLLLLPFIHQALQPNHWYRRATLLIFSMLSLGMQILGVSARDNVFLGLSTYWTPPPNLSFLGELSRDNPGQWPIWGHLLQFKLSQIPVIWYWEWQDLNHFDLPVLLATLAPAMIGLVGLIVVSSFRNSLFQTKWAAIGAWLITIGCVALILGRSYHDPRPIKRGEEAAKLWPAYNALLAQLPALVRPEDAVIFTDRRFEFYLLNLDKSAAQRYFVTKPDQPKILETVPRLLQEHATHGRVWFVTDDLDNRQLAYATELWLHERGRPLEYHLFGDSVQLTAFEPDPTASWTAAIPAQPQLAGLVDPDDYKFNGIAALLGWDWPGLERTTPLILQPGQAYPFELYWIYRGKDPSDLFFVRLHNSTGQKVAEVFTTLSSDTRFIPGRLMVEEARFVLPADLPSADYHLQIGFLTPAVLEGELTFDLPSEMTLIKVSDRQEAGRQ